MAGGGGGCVWSLLFLASEKGGLGGMFCGGRNKAEDGVSEDPPLPSNPSTPSGTELPCFSLPLVSPTPTRRWMRLEMQMRRSLNGFGAVEPFLSPFFPLNICCTGGCIYFTSRGSLFDAAPAALTDI